MSKGWLLVPVVLALGAGLWLAFDRSGTGDSVGGGLDRTATEGRPERAVGLEGRGETPSPAPPPESAPPAASPDAKCTLVVRVLGPDGEGLPVTARVTVHDAAKRTFTMDTDAQARAQFEGLASGEATVEATAIGFIMRWGPTEGLSPDVAMETEVPMNPAATLEGRVVAARDGRPVADALVEVRGGGTLGNTTQSPDRESHGVVRTDADGRFRFTALPLDFIITLVVRAHGYRVADKAMILEMTGDRPPVEIVVEPGGWVSGMVTARDGKPIAGATVFMFPEGGPEAPEEKWWFREGQDEAHARAVTDEAGRYVLDGIALDSPYCAAAEAKGYARSEYRCGLAATEGQPGVVADLVLRRPSTLVVHVQDPEGKPIMGDSDTRAGWGRSSATLRPDGTFLFEGVDPGRSLLSTRVPGFVRVTEAIEVAEGETVERTVRLDRGVSIAGVLVDDAGTPLPHGGVSAHSNEDGHSGGATTDAEGRFLIEGLGSGDYSVTGHASGARTAGGLTVTAPAVGVRLVAPRVIRVVARFTVPPGSVPPKGVMAGAYYANGGGSAGSKDWNDGRVEWSLLALKQRLTLATEGFCLWEREIVGRPGETLDLGEQLLDVGVEVSGRVVDRSGAGIPGAFVQQAEHGSSSARADDDGRFRLEHVPRKSVHVLVSADGFLDEWVAIDGGRGSTPMLFTLHRGGRLLGTVKDSAGAAVQEVEISVHEAVARDVRHTDEWTETDESGRFEARLLPGRYLVNVLRADEVLATTEVTLEEGKDTPLEIRVPRR